MYIYKMKIGLWIRGIHLNSSIVDEGVVVKMSPFIRLRVDSFQLAFIIMIPSL